MERRKCQSGEREKKRRMGREWEEKTNKKRLKELNKKDKDFY
jgi:hypothetical protein